MVFWLNKRWLIPSLLVVPTVIVSPEVCWGITTFVTVLKAFTPFTIVVEPTGIINVSLKGLPSTFTPLMTIDIGFPPVLLTVGVILKALGTSGWVTAVIVWAAVAPLAVARIAVEEPTDTFLRVSVYPKVLV